VYSSIAEKFIILVTTFTGYILGGRFRELAEAKLYKFQGKQYYYGRKWDPAWKKFILSAHIIPEDPEIHYLLANTYFYLERYDYSYEHILKFNSLSTSGKERFKNEMSLLRINIEVLMGRAENGIDLLKKSLSETEIAEEKNKEKNVKTGRITEDRARALKFVSNKNLGNILFKEKRFEEAREHYRKALEIEDDSEIYYNMGLVGFTSKDFKKAIEDFSIAIEKGYEGEDVYFRRGYSYFKTNEFKKAKEDFGKVKTSFPAGKYHGPATGFLETIRTYQ